MMNDDAQIPDSARTSSARGEHEFFGRVFFAHLSTHSTLNFVTFMAHRKEIRGR